MQVTCLNKFARTNNHALKGGEDMPRQFRIARKMKNLKLTSAAQLLGVSQPTLSSWESGRKSPTIENLEKMADLYDVTTDYLLGRTDFQDEDNIFSATNDQLRISNGKPVWSDKYGWLLISSTAQDFVVSNGERISFGEVGKIFNIAPPFAESATPKTKVLTRSEVLALPQVWVEPISSDLDMREHLRGWYQVKDQFVENEYGVKFALSNYGAKWLAFKDC